MADQEAVERLTRSVAEWNEWRHSSRDRRLYGVDLTEADLSHTKMHGAYLHGARLLRANLRGADLHDADLRFADFAHADVSYADLSNAKLHGAEFADADLRHADFSDASLRGAKLPRTRLTGADLSGAELRDADLAGADLRSADLVAAVIRDADLTGANLTRAHLLGTVITNVDLRNVHGLDLVRHSGPSTIGIDTLYKSGGQIPESFLRGCGVPEELIAYLPSLVGAEQAIRFYSVFISYSTKDEEFAKRLHARLQQEHVRVWFAPEDLKGGRKLHEQIAEGIELYDRLLLILSEYSMQSEWVTTEIRRARKQERKENRRKLFPISLCPFDEIREWEAFDADSGKDLGVEVREYYIPDFSNWKDHDAFEREFSKLLKALRDEEQRTR